MRLFKKREANRVRRNDRLWKSRLKRGAMAFASLSLLCGGLTYAAMTGAFAAAGGWAHDKTIQTSVNLGFTVNEILVRGRARIAQDELLAHLGITEGAPVFSVDIAATQERLQEISWVKSVRVSRRLPDKIVVNITEREPLALWQYRKKVSVIDNEGKVLTSGQLEDYQSLPLVVGEEAPAHVNELVALMQAEPEIARQLDSAVRIGNRRWDLRLKSGIDIRLPENNVELALRRLVSAAQDDGILSKDIKVIDLRIPEKLIIEPVAAMTAAGGGQARKTNI